MDRRSFFGTIGGLFGLTAASVACPRCGDRNHVIDTIGPRGPFSIEIISPPQEKARELPLFDTYKQAENFAQARMNLMRHSLYGHQVTYEAGLIKVWSADSQVVYECSWGETWTQAHSYVNAEGRYH